jgi:hypothetical protein
VAKTLLATCTTTVIGTSIKVILKTLLATCTTSGTLIRRTGTTLLANVTTSGLLAKSVAKVLLATVTTALLMIKRVNKTLLAACTTTASVVAHKCIVYTQSVLATVTTTGILAGAVKALAGTVATVAQTLKLYKPQTAPVIPGSETEYLMAELHRVSNAFKAHVEATKSLDARLTAAGF